MPKSREKTKTGTRKTFIRRVKKAVKKSRRALGDEKFKKELERTITFLEKIQTTIVRNHGTTRRPKVSTADGTRKTTTRTRGRTLSRRK
jgi:hypothetical protein